MNEFKIGDEVVVVYYDGYEPGAIKDKYVERCIGKTGVIISYDPEDVERYPYRVEFEGEVAYRFAPKELALTRSIGLTEQQITSLNSLYA